MNRFFFVGLLMANGLFGQGTGVPVYEEGRGSQPDKVLLAKVKKMREAGELVPVGKLTEQMERQSCELTLPDVLTSELTDRERWDRARSAHMRVGHCYQCSKCDDWHLDLAGGYAITEDGAVATCAHVLTEPAQMKEGYLIVATDADVVMAVKEVLAMSMGTDCAVVRVEGVKLRPLALATDSVPGDRVWCFSDPAGKRGYYSEGMVSRFVKRPFLRKREIGELPKGMEVPKPVWLEATVEWAPGSSGSALIDSRGNCIGHVSEIEPVMEELPAGGRARGKAVNLGTQMVFHHAITAGEVRRMIRTKSK